MKAYVLYGIGNIKYEDTDEPVLKDNEVLVKVKASGICGSDIPRIYKTGAYFYPLIPGHEFSGQVVEVGVNADKSWLDKRVGIFPLIPCMECEPCKNESYEMCRKYSYLGSRRNGGFAEYIAVPQENLIELPENVTYEQAAMLEPMAVAVHSMRKVNVKFDDSVVVSGLGTIGMFLIMFLMEQGIKNILVVGNKDFQRENALKLGITYENFCDVRKNNVTEWIMKKTDNKGVDVFFECVGKNENVTAAVEGAAPGGKIMLVGNPYSDMSLSRDVYWKILRNQLTILGTWNSSFTHKSDDDWHYVINKLKADKIKPEIFISHKLEFDNLEKGLEIMREKSEDYIKVMMKNEK